jgi:hypothetical protein
VLAINEGLRLADGFVGLADFCLGVLLAFLDVCWCDGGYLEAGGDGVVVFVAVVELEIEGAVWAGGDLVTGDFVAVALGEGLPVAGFGAGVGGCCERGAGCGCWVWLLVRLG